MPFLRRFLMQTFAKVASNPELRAKATEVFENEVKPRAASAWEQAKPGLHEAARKLARKMAERKR